MDDLEKQTTGVVTRRTLLKKTTAGLAGLAGLLFALSMGRSGESIKKAEAGSGACSVSGCPCRGYQRAYGTDLCGNCGHSYYSHW